MVMAMLESGNQAVLEHLTGECALLERILAAYEEPNAPDTRPEVQSALQWCNVVQYFTVQYWGVRPPGPHPGGLQGAQRPQH